MAVAESSPGSAVINAVMNAIQHEASMFKVRREWAMQNQAQLQENNDEARAAAERWSQCKSFLDVVAPGWLQAIKEDERNKFTLDISRDEEVHAST